MTMKESGQFNPTQSYLTSRLFQPSSCHKGVPTVMNINYIPDYLQYIKKQLTPSQLLILRTYHLQTFLIQLSIHIKTERTLNDLTNQVLEHIRKNNQFWYKNNIKVELDEEIQKKIVAIREYGQDITTLSASYDTWKVQKEYHLKRQPKVTNYYCFNTLHQKNQPNFGTKHPLNHFSMIPDFVVKQVAKQDQESIQIVRQFVIYILSNKKNTQNSKSLVNKISQQCDHESSQKNENDIAMQSRNLQNKKSKMDKFLQWSEGREVSKIENSENMYLMTQNIIQMSIMLYKKSLSKDENISVQRKVQMIDFDSFTEADIDKKLTPSDEIENIISEISEQILTKVDMEKITVYYFELYHQKLKFIYEDIDSKEKESRKKFKGILMPPQEVQRIKQGYNEMLQEPEFVQQSRYKTLGSNIPWKEQQYLTFLKGLSQFFNIPTNNKKIATFIGEDIEPNHVKSVKGAYLNSMKDRMERGQSGGGKKGKALSKMEFLEKDISNFSMKYFEKNKKIKKKKQKKRKMNTSDEDDDDMYSEY